MADREHIPAAKKTVYLDKQMFATIMCMIPAGKLTTQEAICEMWARRKGADFCEIEGGGIMPFDKKLFWTPADVQRVDFITELKDYGKPDRDSLIPYWCNVIKLKAQEKAEKAKKRLGKRPKMCGEALKIEAAY